MTTQDFTHDIDTILCVGNGYWIFKGDKCLKTNMAGDKLMVDEIDITASGAWPALAGTRFARDLDGIAFSNESGYYWFLKAGSCIATSGDGNQIVSSERKIAGGGGWPALDR
ncbi:hypothetical protein AF335_09220 [Streptomyces eurocidicus]|uniref:Hemopexin n=1 Tax=Streptomyces eurocidicus TaxID=66423 RepID=A0A2N8P101_STREU|nr:hypothetical protein [Streptomyces eurocidicus]MBB5121823.1 hypothetical protein [Streptomyces eurocidicus]MBF6055089.1 hypothetical protein [Streptomyces eurocidicus]PNE34688.1 hypothetical protein AF335_09220 [Streptomyces eurocidicus]